MIIIKGNVCIKQAWMYTSNITQRRRMEGVVGVTPHLNNNFNLNEMSHR